MASDIELEGMGQRIRSWRKDQGIKGYELAQRLNISSGSLSEIERGKNLPSASTLASIHLNTDLNVGYVLTGQVAGKKHVAPQPLIVEVDDNVFHVVLKKKK
jgi:transcriptional regulator with XRE-family HTH domain